GHEISDSPTNISSTLLRLQKPRLRTRQRQPLPDHLRLWLEHADTHELRHLVRGSRTRRRRSRHPVNRRPRIEITRNRPITHQQRHPAHFKPRPPKPVLPPLRPPHKPRLTHSNRVGTRRISGLNTQVIRRHTSLARHLQPELTQLVNERRRRRNRQLVNLRHVAIGVRSEERRVGKEESSGRG